MKLLPREEKFFDFFNQQAQLILDASRLLADGAHAGHAQLADAALKIRILEQEADVITHDSFVRLNSTFITPMDPEDLHSLSAHLDDVMDGIEDAVHRMVAYRVQEIPPPALELCRVIHQCAVVLQKAFLALSKNQKLSEHLIEINRLEEVADQIVRSAVSDLFIHETDPIQIIKLKEIYDFLEQTTDYCEDVANTLETVVVKNS